jgi:hypothetical protein
MLFLSSDCKTTFHYLEYNILLALFVRDMFKHGG